MPNVMDAESAARLQQFFGLIGDELDLPGRRESFAVYAMGILGDAERKSAEPIAARACADSEAVDAAHQRLLHFISTSKWSDENVRLLAAAHALDAMREHSPVETWFIDDTGFLKQGKHSVGVQREYTGSAGKVTNCQLGVTWREGTKEDLTARFAMRRVVPAFEDPTRPAKSEKNSGCSSSGETGSLSRPTTSCPRWH